MRSCLCILETVKTLKIILDSAMASNMKNIYHKKTSHFYSEDGFHPKETSWSLGGTKPFKPEHCQINFWKYHGKFIYYLH